jgi:transposase
VIPKELETRILLMWRVEGWPVGTIATQLGVHPDVVERVIASEGRPRPRFLRPTILDPYLPFIEETLRRFPKLRASRLYDMCVTRGYSGCASHFRQRIAELRPRPAAEAYLRLRTLPAEEAQVDWGHFGRLVIGRASRQLMGFVMVLSHSRMIFLRFFLGARMECFLRGHVEAFAAFGGVPRVVLYDNLKSAVVERVGDAIRFHPTLLAMARHYSYQPRPVAPFRGNEKGRVERAIRFVRESFFAARRFKDLADLNAQAREWCAARAANRGWPDDRSRTVREVFEEERERLQPLPETSFPAEEIVEVSVGKTPYVRFEGNDYSVPHTHVRRTLTVAASEELVRILDGLEVVASHARSYDKGKQIEDASHIEALALEKRRARKGRATDRLVHAAPTLARLLEELAGRGENLGAATRAFLELLQRYGAERLERAAREALERGVFDPRSLKLVLERERIDEGRPPVVPVELPPDPRVRGVSVRHHELASYDSLIEKDGQGEDAEGEEGGDGIAQV